MWQLSRPEDCVSDLALDEWATGELAAQALQRVEQHVRDCERCRARHESLERERALFLAESPHFDASAARSIQTTNLSHVRARGAWLGAIALAIAALVLIGVRPNFSAHPSTRSKGGPQLGYFVKRGERIELGTPGTTLHPGDQIRFVYSLKEASYLALFDRDQHSASVYYPSGQRAVRVRAGTEIPLDFSVQLDELPGIEHVHAVFCPYSFELEPLRAALLETGQVPVAADCRLDSLTLRKIPAK